MALFNLPETEQEIYDIVAVHMLRQNAKSLAELNDGVCAYRGKDGLKCAAGCLIPDEVYDSKYEDALWQHLVIDHDFPRDHMQLIGQLQQIHDFNPVSSWRRDLILLANTYSLNTNILKTI